MCVREEERGLKCAHAMLCIHSEIISITHANTLHTKHTLRRPQRHGQEENESRRVSTQQ